MVVFGGVEGCFQTVMKATIKLMFLVSARQKWWKPVGNGVFRECNGMFPKSDGTHYNASVFGIGKSCENH